MVGLVTHFIGSNDWLLGLSTTGRLYCDTSRELEELLDLDDAIEFPSYSTFRCILKTIDFGPFTDLFNSWAAVAMPPMPGERLAIDGKSIRCTVTDYTDSYQNLISTVLVYSHQRGIVLRMQPMSNKKISEVAIVQQLIQEFIDARVVFTLDALHCQKKLYR